jgi:circadian clock protein KaiC
MGKSTVFSKTVAKELPKAPTGINGLDEITSGGLPRGRPTLVCGGAGCGKTLFAMEFLLEGALKYDEPGVFMSFEETTDELAQNIASLGFDLNGMVAHKKVVVDYVHVDRSEIHETGEYDLEGLFVRLGYAIDSIGAKRVVLDTIEALFSGLPNEATLRAELRRLFRWLKNKGVTAVITAERGSGTLTRHGLEEYVSDCVILLDHRVEHQVSTRRLRIVKYRGTTHGTNEYPFLIDHEGISVLPITSLGLTHEASTERISSGIKRLDAMLEGKGYYRGSSILVSGTSGTGKTSVATHFASAACERGERCLYLALEESPSQIMRNLRSVGLDLEHWVKKGLLSFQAARPTSHGLEMHLAIVHKTIAEFKPQVVVVDPVTNLLSVGAEDEVKAMLTRLIDYMKSQQVTGLFTSLTDGDQVLEKTDVGISSLMDTWILLRNIESDGERNRGLYVLKSRGMAHSNQIREFRMSKQGIELVDAYLGPAGVLTGTARLVQEAKEKAEAAEYKQEVTRKRRELERNRKTLEAQIAALKAEFAAQEEELNTLSKREVEREEVRGYDRLEMARSRHAELPPNGKQGALDEIPKQKDERKKKTKARGARR